MHHSMNLPSRWTLCFATVVMLVSSRPLPAVLMVISPVAVGPPSCVSFPGLRDKVLLTKWLQIMDVSALTVLEAGRPKSRCWQDHAPPGVGDPSLPLPSSRWWLVGLGLYMHHTVLCLHHPVAFSLHPFTTEGTEGLPSVSVFVSFLLFSEGCHLH